MTDKFHPNEDQEKDGGEEVTRGCVVAGHFRNSLRREKVSIALNEHKVKNSGRMRIRQQTNLRGIEKCKITNRSMSER